MARYFGYRAENTFGVENTSATIKYLSMGKCTLDPPSAPNLDVPTFEETPDKTKRGLYSPSGDLEIALDIPTMIDFLYFSFGNKVETGTASTGLMYEIYPSGGRKLKSFTAYVGKDDGNTKDFEHVFYGCVISKMTISLSDGLATATLSIQGQKDGKNTLKDESQINIADTYPLAFYEANTTMGETDLSARTTSFEFGFDNGVSASNGQAFGSMFPYNLSSSGKTPSVKTDVAYEGYDFLVKFWGNDNGPVCGTSYLDYHIDFEDEKHNKLQLYFPKINLNTVPQPIEGQDEIKQSLELSVLKGSVTLNDDETSVRTSCLATVELAAVSGD